MKLVMMIVGALLILGGGGAGAYFYFMQPAEASSPEVEEHEVVEKKKKKNPDYFEFVELDPLILPIVDNSGVSQVINLVVVLEVIDASAADKVVKMQPKIKDAYIQDLYGMLNEHAALKGGVIQVSYIKKRLSKISAKVIGDDLVNDVLLQVVQQRPL